MPGRIPTLKSHPELTAAFVLAFHEGLTIAQACVRLDVPRQSFQDWRRWGATENPDGSPRPVKGDGAPKEPYAAFARAMDEALLAYEIALMGEISRQGHDARDLKGNVLLDINGRAARVGDYRALQWILERRFPKRYAPAVRVIVEEQLQAAVAALERNLEPEVFARVLGILARADQGDADDLGARTPPARSAQAGTGTTH